MKSKSILTLAATALLLAVPCFSETVSIKFSYSIPSIGDGDINTWINSYNKLWVDWKNQIGGDLQGEFPVLQYQNSYEFEIRIPIVSILSLSFSAGRFQSSTEGTVTLSAGEGTQTESHFISNQVSAVPIKLGFSLSIPVARIPMTQIPMTVVVSGGRHIVFASYKYRENYEALFQAGGEEYNYWYNKSNSYNSQALGLYASLALEINLIRQLAFVIEGEKTWSKADGFKGPFTYEDYLDERSSGKASLYYYEGDLWGLNKSYPILSGHKDRPEEGVNNVRQGELNFSGFIFKVGLRLKF